MMINDHSETDAPDKIALVPSRVRALQVGSTPPKIVPDDFLEPVRTLSSDTIEPTQMLGSLLQPFAFALQSENWRARQDSNL